MILVQSKLLKRKGIDKEIKEYFKSGKIPKDTAININGNDYCFELLDDDIDSECNIFCEKKEGYEEVGLI